MISLGRNHVGNAKSTATPYSTMCCDAMTFLMDCFVFFQGDKKIDMYLTPLQVFLAVGYSSGGIRNCLIRLRDAGYIIPHDDYQAYKTNMDLMRKFLKDYKKLAPKSRNNGGRKPTEY